MAQAAPTPFAVDSDITPLQGRYFESVAQNVSDPKLRSQLYDKVRATFGGIQQARDIQRAKAQEEEDRAATIELRRAQLDNSRLELGLARDKVRQQQEATAKAQEFNTAFDNLRNYELPGLDPEEAKKRVNLLGSQYSDVVAAVPAAKAKLDLFNNAFETTRRSSGLTAGFIGNAASMDQAEAERIYPGITGTAEWQAAHNVYAKKQDIAAVKQKRGVESAIASSANTAATGLQDILKSKDFDLAANFDEVDQQLRDLNDTGYVTPALKKELREKGIYALEESVPAQEKTDVYAGVKDKSTGAVKKAPVKTEEQLSVLRKVASAARTAASRKGLELAKSTPAEYTGPVAPSASTLGSDE
jgi:hypothetical protein